MDKSEQPPPDDQGSTSEPSGDDFVRRRQELREVGQFAVVAWEIETRRGREMAIPLDVEVFSPGHDLHVQIQGRNALVRAFQFADLLNAAPIRD